MASKAIITFVRPRAGFLVRLSRDYIENRKNEISIIDSAVVRNK
jgi:hypothetical protein